MILEEFDQSRKAIINPEDLNESIKGFPETAVSCFARETFARMLADFEHELITTTSMANIEIPRLRKLPSLSRQLPCVMRGLVITTSQLAVSWKSILA